MIRIFSSQSCYFRLHTRKNRRKGLSSFRLQTVCFAKLAARKKSFSFFTIIQCGSNLYLSGTIPLQNIRNEKYSPETSFALANCLSLRRVLFHYLTSSSVSCAIASSSFVGMMATVTLESSAEITASERTPSFLAGSIFTPMNSRPSQACARM